MPIFVVDNNRFFARNYFVTLLKQCTGFFGNLFVEFLAVAIILVDVFAFFVGIVDILCHQKVYCLASALHTSRCIDAWTNLENHIADGDFLIREPANANYASQSYVRVAVKTLQSKICHHAIFAHNRHNIGGNAHSHEVEKALEIE